MQKETTMTVDQAASMLEDRSRSGLAGRLQRAEGLLREEIRIQLDSGTGRRDQRDATIADLARALADVSGVRAELEQWDGQIAHEREMLEQMAANGRLGQSL